MGPIQKMGGAGWVGSALRKFPKGYPLNYLGCNSYPATKNRVYAQFGNKLW